MLPRSIRLIVVLLILAVTPLAGPGAAALAQPGDRTSVPARSSAVNTSRGGDQDGLSASNTENSAASAMDRATPIPLRSSPDDGPAAVPVSLPMPMQVRPAIQPVDQPLLPRPARVPVLSPDKPEAGEHQKLVVSQMNGEVHFKHLQGPRIDPARALYIETGASAASWCECKMLDCVVRVWKDSQVAIFPSTGVICLRKGALIVKVDKNSERRYTIIAGDLMSRLPGGTVRVQRSGEFATLATMEGSRTILYNRKTGEIRTP